MQRCRPCLTKSYLQLISQLGVTDYSQRSEPKEKEFSQKRKIILDKRTNMSIIILAFSGIV